MNKYIQNTKPDAITKNALNVVGTDWIQLIVNQIRLHENSDVDLQVNKNRLYEVSKKKGVNYWSINAHCKLCKIIYSIYLETKPEPGRTINFCVERQTEHIEENHQNKNLKRL
jgi:hypothetical protein